VKVEREQASVVWRVLATWHSQSCFSGASYSGSKNCFRGSAKELNAASDAVTMSSSVGVDSGVGDCRVICEVEQNGALWGRGEMSIASWLKPGDDDSMGGVVTPSTLMGGVIAPSMQASCECLISPSWVTILTSSGPCPKGI